MPSVYDDNTAGFRQRVKYAAACLANDVAIGTRHFDTCFEMYDGDYVLEALFRRSATNPKLAAGMKKHMNPSSIASAHEELQHLKRSELAPAADAHREALTEQMHRKAAEASV